MSTFKAIVLKSNHIKKDGTINIKIRITHKRKIAYLSTDLFIRPTDMDEKTGTITTGPNKAFINLRLTTILLEYQKKDIQLGDRREFMGVGEIKEFILSGKSSSREIDFFEFSTSYIQKVQVKGTADQYSATVSSLKLFCGNHLPVSEITLNFLLRYENFLRMRGATNGIINYMRTFRSLFNKCRDQYNDEDTGHILIPHYPFRKYTFPKRRANSKEHVLTPEEFRKLIAYVPENESEGFARDMFVLMFLLIGIEAKDLFFAQRQVKGRLIYDRFKTSRLYSIRIEPEAAAIIKRYAGDKKLINVSEQFQHHKSFYRKINNYLTGEKAHHIIGILPKLGINKKVTSKWARHTWATIARNECGINKDDVALCLGHEDEDNRVTDIYIKYDYSIIDSSNRKVLDFVF